MQGCSRELTCQQLGRISIHQPMEIDEDNEIMAQVTELETDESSEHEESIETEAANFYSPDEQLLHASVGCLPSFPGNTAPLTNDRYAKRQRTPDNEGSVCKKLKK